MFFSIRAIDGFNTKAAFGARKIVAAPLLRPQAFLLGQNASKTLKTHVVRSCPDLGHRPVRSSSEHHACAFPGTCGVSYGATRGRLSWATARARARDSSSFLVFHPWRLGVVARSSLFPRTRYTRLTRCPERYRVYGVNRVPGATAPPVYPAPADLAVYQPSLDRILVTRPKRGRSQPRAYSD
jgi:hypothetical protein